MQIIAVPQDETLLPSPESDDAMVPARFGHLLGVTARSRWIG
jgi:hypothetical protein